MSDHPNKGIAKLEEGASHLERLDAPRQQEIKSYGPEADSSDEREAAKGELPAPPKFNPTPKAKNESKGRWYNSLEWWKNKSFTWWKDRLEFIGLFAVVAYAIVTYLQWHDLRRNFQADQRAWVTAKGFSVSEEPAETNDWRPRVFPQNSGKTPGLDFMVQDAAQFNPHDRVPPCFQWIENAPPVRGIISPNAPPESYVEGRMFNRRPSAGELTDYRSHTIDLFFYGMFRYKDVFGKQHWTRWCGSHRYGDPLTTFEFCGACNEVDHE
jgi:hypothetical protein